MTPMFLRLPCGDWLNMALVAAVIPSTDTDAQGEFPVCRVVIPGARDARYTQQDAATLLAWLDQRAYAATAGLPSEEHE